MATFALTNYNSSNNNNDMQQHSKCVHTVTTVDTTGPPARLTPVARVSLSICLLFGFTRVAILLIVSLCQSVNRTHTFTETHTRWTVCLVTHWRKDVRKDFFLILFVCVSFMCSTSVIGSCVRLQCIYFARGSIEGDTAS